MRILGVVPARGGSKGVPDKNIVDLCGKPLLAYTAEAVEASTGLTRTILSTDSEKIASVGRSRGLDVPFLRPAELALDDTPTLPVLQHALDFLLGQGEKFDAVCVLQPTSPLRTGAQIDAACESFARKRADTLLSVLAIPHQYHPDWALVPKIEGGDELRWASGERNPVPRRQQLSPAYHREGSIYIVKAELLLNQNTLYGEKIVAFPVEEALSVNIDSPADLERAERILCRGAGQSKA